MIFLSQASLAGSFQTIAVKGSPKLEVSEKSGIIKLSSNFKDDKKPAVSYAWRAITAQHGQGNAISFEVRGDGSDFLASVFLGESKFLLDAAHEASFSLASKQWHEVTIPFSDFVQNQKPWGVKKMDGSKLIPKMATIKNLGFGRGFHYHRFDHPSYAFEVRKVKFIQLPETAQLPLKQGLKMVKKKLASGQKLNVLLLGDSITEMGKDQSHFVHAMSKRHKEAIVVNAAIGGHSVRGGELVLSRSLKKMPKPDLVFIMYGANDCKAITETSGFNSEVFEQQLLSLIHKVNRQTSGQSEFLLVNGAPRIDRDTFESKGFVEPLAPAYKRISEKHGLVLCDSLSTYLKLSAADKELYYRDTIHQNQEGLKFLGSLIANTIQKAIK